MFLDYVTIMTRLPQLLDAITAENDEGAVPDVSQAEEIDNLTKRVQNIVMMLPDILHRSLSTDARHPAALEEMTKDLIRLVERAKPLLLVSVSINIQLYKSKMKSLLQDGHSTVNSRRIGWSLQSKSCKRTRLCSIFAEHRSVIVRLVWLNIRLIHPGIKTCAINRLVCTFVHGTSSKRL